MTATLTTIAAFLFIVTSVVSAAYVLAMFSTGGSQQPSVKIKLVWGVIFGGGALFFLRGPLNTIGLNIIIVWGALYFLQGLAVLVTLLHKWSVPHPLRVLIYGFFIIQTFGIVFLSIIGLAEVWTDLRKLNIFTLLGLLTIVSQRGFQKE